MKARSDVTIALIGIALALAGVVYVIGTASALWVFGAYVLEAQVGMTTEVSGTLVFLSWLVLLIAPIATIGFVRSSQ